MVRVREVLESEDRNIVRNIPGSILGYETEIRLKIWCYG